MTCWKYRMRKLSISITITTNKLPFSLFHVALLPAAVTTVNPSVNCARPSTSRNLC